VLAEILLFAAACAPCELHLKESQNLDLRNPQSVFAHVFRQLPDEVEVFPSENHLYFAFPSAAGELRGNLWLDVAARDRGILGIVYAVRNQGEKVLEIDSDLRAPFLSLRRRAVFDYEIEFEHRTVRFLLHRLVVRYPVAAKLRRGEEYVGPSFDESGLEFALVFCMARRHFLWILNEDALVPEEFDAPLPYLAVGKRTRFVFYRDRQYSRLILVGVSLDEVMQNSPFDGPFDQLPDNYIELGEVNLDRYLAQVLTNPHEVDRFGRSRNGGLRTSILPYVDYRTMADLDFVRDCRAQHRRSEDAFYACLAGAE
jgi:hypothetical protein